MTKEALTFGDKARFYIGRFDWPVFPLHDPLSGRCSCGLADCPNPGKHPRTKHGFKDATRDLDQIDLWDWEFPQANIAMPTGKTSGIVIIDIDGEKGQRSLEMLEERNFRLPETATVRTGNGRHLYYEQMDGVRNSASKLAPGIDIRGDGGQAILPPSVHISGRTYTWEIKPTEVPPRLLPDWIPKALDELDRAKQKRQYREALNASYKGGKPPLERIDEYAMEVARLPRMPHARNHTLNRCAFIGFQIAQEHGISDSLVMDRFLIAAQQCGLTVNEARATIRSAQRSAQQRPWERRSGERRSGQHRGERRW